MIAGENINRGDLVYIGVDGMVFKALEKNERDEMDIETTRGIAARIWCDIDYSHEEMDVDLAEKIAQMLLENANKSESINAVKGVTASTFQRNFRL